MSGEATFEAGIFTWTPMNASLPPWHLPRLLLEGKECSYKKAAKPPYFYIMIKPVGISATVVRFSTEPPRDELLRRLKHAHDTAQTLPVPPLVAVYQGLLAARRNGPRLGFRSADGTRPRLRRRAGRQVRDAAQARDDR